MCIEVRIRCFIAVDIPLNGEALMKYNMLTGSISSAGAVVRTVEPENLHVTLKFLGEVEEGEVMEVVEALKDVKRGAFTVELNGIGGFPSNRNPRIVWIGIHEGYTGLRALHDEVEGVLIRRFPREGREFKAHLTIARIRRGGRALAPLLERFADEDFGTIHIREFKLKRSELTPRGPIYTDIEVYPLEDRGDHGEG